MTEGPFRGAFPHQHGDPRGLIERIHAQLRDRIEEAVEMAGLELLVHLRRRDGQPAPETSSAADRREFEQTARDLLLHLREAFHAELGAEERAALEQAEAPADERACLLAGQALLARRLPDYWQRFETHRAAYVQARLLATAAPNGGWLGRLLGSS